MQRREFISLLGGATAAWPLAARAQQDDRIRRIGVLMDYPERDPQWSAHLATFQAALHDLGWTDGRNVQMAIRWAASDPDPSAPAAELIALSPEVIFASPHRAVAAMRKQTATTPIVAAISGDPIRAGFVQSYARPGGNITAFLFFETTINTKYLQLLKEIAPTVTRAAVIQSENSAWRGDFTVIETAARSIAVETVAMLVRSEQDIEREIAEFASRPNGGLIVPPDTVTIQHRRLILALAAEHHLPAVYASRGFVTDGGLMCYTADFADVFRGAASYVDRILRGEKPADLPVQTPTRYELVINLKTAKALGLDVPPMLLVRADEVIE
jgi:putative tryptophan/tyrosine transport system substrate-binding protein